MPGGFVTVMVSDTEPTSLQDLKEMPEEVQREWELAMESELASLEKMQAWEEVKDSDIPKDINVVSSKWVFKVKSDGRKKARLVARGFTQQYGIDYTETYAPVAKFASFRFLLAQAALQQLSILQFDVPTAYLNGKLEEEIFMALPDGKVVRLLRALYGLKQGARCWYTEIDSFFDLHGFKRSEYDHGVYFNHGITILLYVDDLLIFSDTASATQKDVSALVQALTSAFSIRSMGQLGTYLGIEVERQEHSNGSIRIHQRKYLESALQRFGMEDCKAVSTPMEPGLKLVPNPSDNGNGDNIIDRKRQWVHSCTPC